MAKTIKSETKAPGAVTTIAAAAVVVLAAAEVTYFGQAGEALSSNDSARGRLLGELGDHLKTCKEYAQWEAARMAFIEGCKKAGHVSPNDVWDRAIRDARAMSLIGEKPKAPTAEATKKSAQREAEAKAIADVQKGKTVAELAKAANLAAQAAQTAKAAALDALAGKIAGKVTPEKAAAAQKTSDAAIAQASLLEKAAVQSAKAVQDAELQREKDMVKLYRDQFTELTKKATGAQWLELVKAAKKIGLKSEATPLALVTASIAKAA